MQHLSNITRYDGSYNSRVSYRRRPVLCDSWYTISLQFFNNAKAIISWQKIHPTTLWLAMSSTLSLSFFSDLLPLLQLRGQAMRSKVMQQWITVLTEPEVRHIPEWLMLCRLLDSLRYLFCRPVYLIVVEQASPAGKGRLWSLTDRPVMSAQREGEGLRSKFRLSVEMRRGDWRTC